MIQETNASGNIDDLLGIGAGRTVKVDGDLDLSFVCFPGNRGLPCHGR